MGEKMAQGSGLTARQEKFLAVVLQEPYLLKHFYLSGGTALSSWYLHHRVSQDIDLFSENEVNPNFLNQWLLASKHAIGFSSFSYDQQFGFHFYTFKFPHNEQLKVDFSYYPSERIEKGLNWRGLSIDSLYDIAVNKIQTISGNPRGRDYVDLFFVWKKTGWSFDRLRRDAVIKHGVHIETIHLAKQCLMVSEFTDIPKMLVPFSQKEMEDFFLHLAKKLEKEIFY